MAAVSSWHLKPDLAKKTNVLFLPGNRRAAVPAVPRACRRNQRGFAVLAGGCLPYLLLLRREGKRGQLSTSVVLSGCLNQRAGAGVGTVPGRAPRWHGAAGAGDQRLLLTELLPHERSHSSFIGALKISEG